ncbi:galactokinase [Desulfococcaceae bacterium HSG9]|nr:galactokinase [Desulfococcaceae bacterium HSG9]
MKTDFQKILENRPIEVSAPCRLDMGGTLDINTFNYPLRHLNPCTFNIAIGLRTYIRLEPYTQGIVKISSKGFDSAEFTLEEAPFDHPLGLMFAIAAYFRADGIHILIDSSSPPCSALGGSSAAAVALTAAFKALIDSEVIDREQENEFRHEIAVLAHALEASVAGAPCGFQDQLAAVFGGVNLWHWTGQPTFPFFKRQIIISDSLYQDLEAHLLLAFCGIPHASKDINSRWVRQFVSGRFRNHWKKIINVTDTFGRALKEGDFQTSAQLMNMETALRCEMTSDVLDDIGWRLVKLAVQTDCGARFTGAGGGGCIWALGDPDNISKLKNSWQNVLAEIEAAGLLEMKIDSGGLRFSQ